METLNQVSSTLRDCLREKILIFIAKLQANPFFIRCIKSNPNKIANQFDDATVTRQVRETTDGCVIKLRNLKQSEGTNGTFMFIIIIRVWDQLANISPGRLSHNVLSIAMLVQGRIRKSLEQSNCQMTITVHVSSGFREILETNSYWNFFLAPLHGDARDSQNPPCRLQRSTDLRGVHPALPNSAAKGPAELAKGRPRLYEPLHGPEQAALPAGPDEDLHARDPEDAT